MTSRTVIDRRQEFARRQRAALAASLTDFSKLTVDQVRQRIHELASQGVSEQEIARLTGFTIGMVRARLSPADATA